MESVVIVDDDANYRELVSLVLTHSCGVQAVHAFGDGASALRHLADPGPTQAPALVLLDLHMPRGDGLQVLRQLREARTSVPVAFLSGAVSEQERADCMAQGAVAVLTKPVAYAELVGKLRSLVASVAG